MKIYSLDGWKIGKKLMAKGQLKGTGKSQEQLKAVNDVEVKVMTTVTTTVDMMPVDEYRDMVDPLLNIFRKRRGRR